MINFLFFPVMGMFADAADEDDDDDDEEGDDDVRKAKKFKMLLEQIAAVPQVRCESIISWEYCKSNDCVFSVSG